jgi:hypothetical protein
MQKLLDVYRHCIPKHPERAVKDIDDIVGAADEGER